MAPVRKRKPMNRKRYVKSEKAKKRRAKRETEEDMNQNFRIKEVEKKVSQLTKGNRNVQLIRSASTAINTVVGVGKNANMTLNNHAIDLNLLGSGVGTMGYIGGNSTIWKHIELSYFVNQDPLAETADIGTGTTVRVMVVCIHKPGPSSTESVSPIPTFAEIFQDNDADATAMISADILRGYNRLNRQNFEVLYDKFHVLAPLQMAVTTAGNLAVGNGNVIQSHPIRLHLYPSKRSQNQTTNQYDGGVVANYTNIQQNQYWMFVMTDNADNSVPPTITFNATVDYLE